MKKQKLLWRGAAVLAVLGACAFSVKGMRFSGLLLWGLCFFLILFASLERLQESKPWAKPAKRLLLALFGIGVLGFFVMEAQVLAGPGKRAEETDVSCVVVLGAGIDGTQPSLTLKSRLDAALAYIEDKPDVPVIVSGCRGVNEEISEAECMYRYLTEHGVDGARIWKEEQASSTRTNFTYSLALMRERGIEKDEPFAVVTSDYHAARARFLARGAGVADENLTVVPASMPGGAYYWVLTANYYVREAFALANEMLFRVDLDV